MKLIQILALVAALAVTAAAQSTSTNSQNSGSTSPTTTTGKTAAGKTAAGKTASGKNGGTTNQTPPVTLTVPKGSQTTAGSKNSASTKSATANGAAKKTAASKTAVQTPASKTPAVVVKPVSPSTANTKTASTAKAKKTAPVTTKKSVAAKAVSPKKAVVAKKKDQVKVVTQKEADNKKAGSGVQTIKSGPAGRRDPFLSIIRNAPSGPVGPSCSVGKKCLYIPELVVKGIAKDTDGQMLAVVTSNTHRAYFLRENDQVFNGSVEKITSDSVVFREYATDHVGRETAHEVVKRIPKT